MNRSNSKIVREKIKEHIFEYYEFDDLVGDVEAVKHPYDDTYNAAKRLVEGGCFLIYHTDVREFLESLNLNNKSGKTFSDDDCWQMYTHLLAREIEKIIS